MSTDDAQTLRQAVLRNLASWAIPLCVGMIMAYTEFQGMKDELVAIREELEKINGLETRISVVEVLVKQKHRGKD